MSLAMSLVDRDAAAISRLQKLRFFPLAVTGGEGCYLIDEAGRRLLDLSGSWGAVSLGHGHPALRAAVDRALANQAGASILSGVNGEAVALAEELLQLVPGTGARRVWFGHSGSDANETAYRSVAAASGRPRVISFIGAYHGCTAGSMAISGHTVQQGTEKAPGLLLLPYPDPYRPYQDDASGQAVLDLLARHFETDCPPQEVAAIFLEPIQSDGGLIVPPEGFLKGLEALCRRHGILLVCDEVKVGLGRSGLLHCFQHEGLTPDLVVLGKGLGGGLPISALVGPAEILDHATAFAMQTLHGNPVSAAAARAVLQTIEAEGLVANAAKVGEHLIAGLKAMQQRHPGIGDVRGRGLALGVELVTDRESRSPDAKTAAKLVYRAAELGLVLYYVGMSSNVLEMTPPLVLSTAEADRAVQILDQALTDVAAGKVPDERLAGYEGW